MRQRPVIAALLDTGDSFLHLEQQQIDMETAEELDYSSGRKGYGEYVEKALQTGEKLPNYHSVAEKLAEDPSIVYENDLLRPEAENQVEQGLRILERNRDRPLNDSEIEAVVSTAMKETEAFPRRAIDKEELLDRMYMEIYVEDGPSSLVGDEPVP